MTVAADHPSSPDKSDGASVLVVDDEPAVRRLLGTLLQGHGYRALLASNGAEARAAVEMEDVLVILCDVHLRGESGTVLAKDLLRRSPQAVVLMMSGGDESGMEMGWPKDSIYGLVPKPFDAKEIMKRIARALCSSRMGTGPEALGNALL